MRLRRVSQPPCRSSPGVTLEREALEGPEPNGSVCYDRWGEVVSWDGRFGEVSLRPGPSSPLPIQAPPVTESRGVAWEDAGVGDPQRSRDCSEYFVSTPARGQACLRLPSIPPHASRPVAEGVSVAELHQAPGRPRSTLSPPLTTQPPSLCSPGPLPAFTHVRTPLTQGVCAVPTRTWPP